MDFTTATRKPGDKMEDGSYYMGISNTTGTGFFVFFENLEEITKIALKSHRLEPSFNEAEDFLRKKHQERAKFHGHLFSAQQTRSEIITAKKKGTADGGIRRLTKVECDQMGKLMLNNQDLLKEFNEGLTFPHHHDTDIYIQTATQRKFSKYHSLMHDSLMYKVAACKSYSATRGGRATLLLGRSEP